MNAVRQDTSGIPRIGDSCEFSDRHYILSPMQKILINEVPAKLVLKTAAHSPVQEQSMLWVRTGGVIERVLFQYSVSFQKFHRINSQEIPDSCARNISPYKSPKDMCADLNSLVLKLIRFIENLSESPGAPDSSCAYKSGSHCPTADH